MLTDDQVNQYHDQGFLVLERLFQEEEIERLCDAAHRIVDEFDIDAHRTVFKTTDRDSGRDDYFFESAERVHCFLEEHALDSDGQLRVDKARAINKIGHALHDHVPEFSEFCRQPALVELIRDIGYRTPSLWQTMLIFKQPHIGGVVRWHQDASYLVSQPNTVMGMWVALEDADRGNGCLWVAPGAHRSPLREIYEVDWQQRSGTLRELDDTPWPAEGEGLALEAPKGSLVLFHDHMPHYSSANTSPRSRLAFTVHVAEAGSAWSPKNWLQRPNLGHFML